jgi:hypothetical protein
MGGILYHQNSRNEAKMSFRINNAIPKRTHATGEASPAQNWPWRLLGNQGAPVNSRRSPDFLKLRDVHATLDNELPEGLSAKRISAGL